MTTDGENDLNQVPANDGQGQDKKGAAVKFPPPAIFVLLIFVGAGLHYLLPLPLGVPESFQPVGIAITLFGVAVAILVNGTFKRVGTAIEPWKPTTSLITTGFYRWSRNPIYVGFCLFNIGIGISANNLWILLTFIPGAILVYYIAIEKEEQYLEQKFGQEYLDYKAKVRRWV
ncbi:MAG: isoprenylcysteine carboxylmethyltransferase family protein [Pseudomonadales bacterium]|nr:isoprenylcysteine carboxylmethyltransferase family protein [Pseudomonadales bacterium]